jgi:bifunctional UDP-N-acetylglucosamine pyrophosphorylase/glucosamine-1-phosphate N-acetyltransferase
MKSDLPKVLHSLLGRPMLTFPVQAAFEAGAERVVVVVGYGREHVEAALQQHFGARVTPALQASQRGTGDAARCGQQAIADFRGWLVILNGDAPVITDHALSSLIAAARSNSGPLAMLTASIDDPTGYGRILRDSVGNVIGIREERDCSAEQKRIREWNPGVYAIDSEFFAREIGKLSTNNAQGELYLTDLVGAAAVQGGVTAVSWDAGELVGVNDRFELAQREKTLRVRRARMLALSGVTIRDFETTYIDADVHIAPGAVIEPNVTLRGKCVIEAGAVIDVGAVLTNVVVRGGALVKPYTVATDSEIGTDAQVGPFSHLRPGSLLGPESHIGNFVETKKTRIGRGSKANHLAYLGDGEIGERVNVGAGTIFCNYDGFNKHVTTLEDDVFIGSDSQLVAPVTVGKGAYVGTGTTVTKNVPPDALAIGRAKQENKVGLAARLKSKLKSQRDAKK